MLVRIRRQMKVVLLLMALLGASDALLPRGFFSASAPRAFSSSSSSSSSITTRTSSSSTSTTSTTTISTVLLSSTSPDETASSSSTPTSTSGPAAAAADPSLFSGAGGLDPEVTGQIAALTSELVWLGERNMYHKIVRKYKALRKLGAYPDGAGYSAVLKACMDGKIGAVADKVVLDMLASPPEDGLKMADMMTALRACARSSRPVEALEILAAMDQMPAKYSVRPNMACYALAMEAIRYAPPALPVEDLARRVMKQVRSLLMPRN